MHKKRILVLTPRFPYPVIGGDRLRIFELCRALAKRYELTLLSLCESDSEMSMPVPEDGVFHRVERVLLPKWRSVLQVLAALPGRCPLQVAYYRSKEFLGRVSALIREHDACLAHLIRTAQYVQEETSALRILEMTDAISLNYFRVRTIRGRKGIRSWVYGMEAERVLAYERSVAGRFEIITLVSEVDRNFLWEDRAPPGVLVCGNGTNMRSMVSRGGRSPVGVFIGNMKSLQNLDASLYFAQEVLPRVRALHEFTFRVVGRISPQDRQRLERFEGVEVRANVEDVAKEVVDARVGLAPVRIGAGVQNKVLEYLALGLPVVASPVALEGLGLVPGRDVLLAETTEQYVSAISALWRDEAMSFELARNGQAYVTENCSWEKQLEPLMKSVERKLQARAQSADSGKVGR